MRQLSGSALQRLWACQGAAVLPQVDRTSPFAEAGTAKHSYFRNLKRMDREEALALVSDEYRELCEAVVVDDLPLSEEFLAELAVAYDVDTDTCREIGEDKDRNYGPLGPREIPMTLDLAADGEEYVFVGDYKTGRGYVTPARRNLQLRAGALAMARLKGRSAARVAIVHVREHGQPFYDVAHFDAFELELIAAELRELMNRVEAAREADAAGASPALATGEHCRYCPSFQFCPAQTVLLRQVVAEPERVTQELKAMLTPETAGRAYLRYQAVKTVLREVEKSLRAYAAEHPIPLGDGAFYGPVAREKEVLDAEVVREVLKEQHGADIADRACEFSTSKAAIDRAVRVVQEAKKQAGEKVTLTSLNKAALDAVRERKGFEMKKTTELDEYRTSSAKASSG